MSKFIFILVGERKLCQSYFLEERDAPRYFNVSSMYLNFRCFNNNNFVHIEFMLYTWGYVIHLSPEKDRSIFS